MKKISIAIVLLCSFFWSCKTDTKASEKQEYLRWVGDIEHNEHFDTLAFKVCNGDSHVFQYFNLGNGPVYSGEKSTVINTFKSRYQAIPNKSQDGLIRIRFIVNCEGKAGRFRVLQSDYDYQEIEFDKKIVSQLLSITKEIEKWAILQKDETAVDYYMYLIFKINDGYLTEILP